MLEHDLGHVGTSLQVTALLTREEITFRTNDGTAGQSGEKTKLGLRSVVSHGSPPELERCSSWLAYTIHCKEESRCPHHDKMRLVECRRRRTSRGEERDAGYWDMHLEGESSMKVRAAVLNAVDAPLEIADLDLDPPRAGEVLVRIAASGVCHSDVSTANGTIGTRLPTVLGHEGAGVVEVVGPAVASIAEGDHVVLSWNPSCGACEECLRGLPHLCTAAWDAMFAGGLMDGTPRLHRDGREIYHYSFISSFADRAVVPARSCVRIDPAIPLDIAALVGCAVTTGIGVLRQAGLERNQGQVTSREEICGSGQPWPRGRGRGSRSRSWNRCRLLWSLLSHDRQEPTHHRHLRPRRAAAARHRRHRSQCTTIGVAHRVSRTISAQLTGTTARSTAVPGPALRQRRRCRERRRRRP
jgi:hypothetical protein